MAPTKAANIPLITTGPGSGVDVGAAETAVLGKLSPILLEALTVMLYEMVLVRPVTIAETSGAITVVFNSPSA